MTAIASVDSLLASAASNGVWPIFLQTALLSATTAADAACGGISIQKYPHHLIVDAALLGTGVTGVYFPTISLCSDDAITGVMAALGYSMGSLVFSSGTFIAQDTMPTKTVRGSSVQTASLVPLLIVITTLVATTPTITITYTNQAGTGGRTASMTLPANAAENSAFLITPHLQSGDTGIRAVTNITTSAGTGGTVAVYGLLPLFSSVVVGTVSPAWSPNVLSYPENIWLATAGEKIYFFRFGAISTTQLAAMLVGVAET
jgi:hypothetical protein